MPHIAARPAPHFAASRPALPHAAPEAHRAAFAAHAAPREAFAHATPRQAAAAQALSTREQRITQHQRDTLTRQSAERDRRIDRLQQHVQQLQAQAPQSRRAQRELATQQRVLQHEQQAQQRDHAAQQRLAAQPATAQPSAAAKAAQTAASGRFAAHFRNNADPNTRLALAARLNGWSPRDAWRHHAHAAFVPWLGPVFWPYAYADIFDYTFWPEGYDDAYWAYAYDDLVDTVFWDAGSPYSAYASIAPEEALEPGGAMVGASQLRARSGMSERALRQLCSNPSQGVTAWPIAEITRAVKPTAQQRTLLDQLKHSAAQAADALKSSCSDIYALTPPGRLQAMINRVSATLEAVRMVRPALEAFYNSLSDEQQARFNAIGPQHLAANPSDQSAQNQPSKDQPQQQASARPEGCGASKTSLTRLPIERIDTVLHPTGAQKDKLDRLGAATKKAVQELQAACPDETPVTPVGRLQAMEKRLSAMLQAANEVKPALDDFYASLGSEQKERFNTLQQVAAQ
jgi:TolA-binding protein